MNSIEINKWKGSEKNVLVLNYTLSCPLTCDFCCYKCSPKRKEKMSVNLAKKLIKEAGELKQFSSIAFSGGEPLLFLDEIKLLGKIAKKYSIPFTINTSGYWAKDYTTTFKILKDLKFLGLEKLTISHDPSHAKFVCKKKLIISQKSLKI